MEICILGAGRTGQAMVAYLADKGVAASIWDRSPDKRAILKETGVAVTGQCAGQFRPHVQDDIAMAAQADLLLVMTVAEGHGPVARLLSGYLRPGQTILILNGNLGAWEFYRELGREAAEKQVRIAETGGMILLADYYGPGGSLHIRSVKNEMDLAAIPAGDAPGVAAALEPVFPQLRPVASVIETSLCNSNPVLHAPITLFNISRMENGEDYLFYDTAASPSVVRFCEALDTERCRVVEALGGGGKSCVDIINGFWPDKYDNLYDVIKHNPSYMAGKGPKTLDYRYITEDIPYGIAPIAALGRLLGVDTPVTDALLTCFRALLGRDFLAGCPNLEGFLQAAAAQPKPPKEVYR